MDKPTIATVASKAGVSASTAKRAFNNKPDVNGVTRKRILKIAEELQVS